MVSIGLRHENERLVMKISDDGVGIYPGCRRKPNSFGLVGIGERVSSLRGEFNVDSVPGQGTVLTISIPLVISPEADEAVTGSARSKSASPESVLLRPMDRSREYRAAKMNDQ